MLSDFYLNHRDCDLERKRKFSAASNSTQSSEDEYMLDRQNCSRFCKKPAEQKYKTELCKNFSETGFCPYQKKCRFAHGVSELNAGRKQQGRFYRTRKCNTFWNEGICPYGRRCQFMHVKAQKSTAQYLNIWKMVIQMQTNESGFEGSRLLRLLQMD